MGFDGVKNSIEDGNNIHSLIIIETFNERLYTTAKSFSNVSSLSRDLNEDNTQAVRYNFDTIRIGYTPFRKRDSSVTMWLRRRAIIARNSNFFLGSTLPCGIMQREPRFSWFTNSLQLAVPNAKSVVVT